MAAEVKEGKVMKTQENNKHNKRAKGSIQLPKRMNFRKSSEWRGVRVISNPKIHIAKFGPLNGAFSA